MQEDNVVDDAVTARSGGAVVATRLQHHLYHPTALLFYLPTHPPTHPLTHPPAHPSTHPPTHSPTRPSTHPPTHSLNLLTSVRLHLPQREARLAREAAYVEQLGVVRAREHL